MRIHTPEPPSTEDAAELLSDVLQAEAAILWDRRAAGLRTQLTIRGLTIEQAAPILQGCLDSLGTLAERYPETVSAFASLGHSMARLQGGTVFLHGLGCRCGHGFWTESDEGRALSPGEVVVCPRCRMPGTVPG